MKKIYTVLLLAGLFLLSGCDKYLDIKPVGSVIPSTLVEYRALLARAYKDVPGDRGMACLRSDEMQVTNTSYDRTSYADIENWNDLATSASTLPFSWLDFYNVLFIANQVIDNKDDIKDGGQQEIDQLVGEAYLLRGYMHFLLVNLYGQPYTESGALTSKSVPLKLDVDLETVLSRNTVEEVYTSILADIEDARLLINKESWETKFSYRFTVLAVEAFQSRTSLYMGQWQRAYDAAEAVLAMKSSLEDLSDVSVKLPNHFESVENITALELAMSSTLNNAVFVSASFIDRYEEGDQRVALYFSGKDSDDHVKSSKGGYSQFKSTFRVGEMYLNAAEAAARLDKLPEARARLLQLIEKRYTAEAYALKTVTIHALDKDALITAILNERALELAFEGHRWFDLRRTTRPRIEKVLDGKPYVLEQDDPRYTLLIPKDAIAANPGLAN